MVHTKRFLLMAAWCVLLAILAFMGPQARAAGTQQMIEPHAQAMPLMPFLDYLVDETMLMDIEEAARASGWQPLSGARLPREEGALWLRFTIAPIQPDAKPQTFLLDMGQSVPGKPTLYEPITNELSGSKEWRENLPSQRNIILLPEASAETQLCFIRLDGFPGPWFAPMIRTPHNAATNWSSLARPGAVLALGVVMILCLLRGLGEKGQWRYWTALFVAAALAQAIVGMPLAVESYTARDIAAVLLPGIALMMLPHIGRHLMNTPSLSKAIDIQLFLLSLPGIILALLPLAPGWDWLDRWLALWPLGAALFIPTALGAWMAGLPGGRRFLLASLILPLFTALALVGMEFGIPASILASGPDWGVVLAALILAAATMPGVSSPQEKESKGDNGKSRIKSLSLETDPIINLEHPLDDPNLRLIPPMANAPLATQPTAPLETFSSIISSPPVAGDSGRNSETEKRELALREPVDEIMRETAALAKGALSPAARSSVEKLTTACQLLANIISRPGLIPASQIDRDDSAAEEVFNLEKVLRNAHDSVASSAEYAGIALSWYMPPHLGPLFRGDARTLEEILRLLLESAARSTTHGAIKLSARRVPDSSDPGHILFTVDDEGKGYPPLDRSSLALAKAWELAGQSQGYLSMDSSANGSTISFSVHFTPLDNTAPQPDARSENGVGLAASEPGAKRSLARIIEAADYQPLNSDSMDEVIHNQKGSLSPLLILQGDFARPAAADMVREFIRLGRQGGYPSPHVLAITKDQSEWRLLKASGFTHAMLEPVDPDVLRRTIMRLVALNRPETAPASQADADKTPLFNESGASLDADRAVGETGADSQETASSMLMEQDVSLGSSFEGPEWLSDDEDELPLEPQSDSSVVGRDAREPENAQDDDMQSAMLPDRGASLTHEPSVSETVSAPSPVLPRMEEAGGTGADEWVGEPMPVGTPISASRQAGTEDRPQKTENQTAPSPDFDKPGEEAVSSPLPPQPGGENDGGLNGSDKESLLDYIIIPEPESGGATSDGQTDKPERPASTVASGANSSVMDFVNSSVAMVTSTLSSMLKHSAPKTLEIEEKTPESAASGSVESDPEIMALVARIDEAMNQANAAFAGRNAPAIAAATGIIVREAEEFGLRRLARLANCVERAARNNDLGAVQDLIPDLAIAVERNRIIISQKND